MMKFVLVFALVAMFASPVRCQDDGEGVWNKLKNAVKEFVSSMRSLFSQMKDEIKARTADIRDWTKEMFDSFKTKMNEWVDEVKASDSEKEDMRNYIEKLQMPAENEA